MITVNDQGATLSSGFNAASTAVVQKVKPKVIAEWRNSRTLSNVSVSLAASDYTSGETDETAEGWPIGHYFDVRQVMNGWNKQTFAWPVAGDKDVDGNVIRADGTWSAIPEKNDGTLEFGWRGKVKSNSSGVFTTPPIITATFDQEKINYIEVHTSEYSGAIKEYTLEYKNTSDNYVAVVTNHELAKGTSMARHTLSGGDTIDIRGVRLTIYKTQNPLDYARVNEITPIYETDISDYVMTFSYSKNRELYDTTVPLGGIAANTFNMNLDNTGHEFTIGNNKLYGQYLAKDVKLTVSLGWRTGTDPEIYEYVNCGTYWVDEWKNHSSMNVAVQCRDFTRFLIDSKIEGGFIVRNSDGASAMRQLMMTANFPRADFEALFPYQLAVREDGGVAHYRFNEGAASGGLTSGTTPINPSTGLLARWWILGDFDPLSREALDESMASDRLLSSGISGLAGKEYISYKKSPSVVGISTVGNDAVNITEYPSDTVDEYYHTVIDGYFIPPSSDDYAFRVTIENGGFKLYVGGASSKYIYDSSDNLEKSRKDIDSYKGELRLSRWFNDTTEQPHTVTSISLLANQPAPIRIEAFHVVGDFKLKLERKIGDGSWATVADTETTTDIAFDVIGGRDDYVSANNYSSAIRNHGVYSGDPILRKPGGSAGDPKDLSVQFDSTDFVTIPYDESIDMTDLSSENYTGSFSIEALVKFTDYVSGEGVYAGNLDNPASGTGTKGIGLFHTGSDHGVKFINTSGTSGMATASAGSAGGTGAWRHVVATYDGTNLKYYVNGALVATATSVGSPALWENQDFLIGKFAGFVGEFAIYRTALSANKVRDHYYSTIMSEIRIHPYLFGESERFSIAGNIATGDLGMFYFDEFGKFRYDHFNRLHESEIPQHSTSQATLSDSTNIKSAERRLELLANKVTVKVNPTISKNVGISSIWRPPNSSLTATKITSGVTISDSETTEISSDNTYNPPWEVSGGYIKIEDEIIKYDSIDGNYFKTLTRGQFGTTAASHAAGEMIREVRYFQFDWSKVPAVDIRSPYIAGIEFEDPPLISIDRFRKRPYGGEIVLSATENIKIEDSIGEVVFIEGKNDYTGVSYFASIAGRTISDGGSIAKISSQSSAYSESVRKYGIKEVTIDNRFIGDDVYAKRLADFLLDKMQNSVPIIDVQITSMPQLQLGDRVTVEQIEQLGISNKQYWVIESKINYSGSVSQSLTLREVV